jgi:acylphosphatase
LVEQRSWRVSGRVQGVGFRWFVLQCAKAAGVAGWVRNTPDGAVEVLATGDSDQLELIEKSLNKGPLASRVDGVVDISKQHEQMPLKTFDII